MDDLLYLYVTVIVLAAALASIAFWAPRKVWVRVYAFIVASLMIPAAYASLSQLLSQPKPVSLEWAKRSLPEATVLGANMIEGKAIYLWLRLAGTDEPRAYVLPWNKKLARQLHKAQRQAKQRGGKTKMRRPFDRDRAEVQPRFYADSQPALPPKPAGPAPLMYDRSKTGR